MKFNRPRSSPTDDHLSAVLHTSTSDFRPDFSSLVQEKHRLDSLTEQEKNYWTTANEVIRLQEKHLSFSRTKMI